MADLTVNGMSVPFLPVGGTEGLKERPPLHLADRESFDAVLEKELQQVKFSKHAQERLSERNITLNDQDRQHIGDAVTKAEAKGAQESLVLLRDLAFIVNIRNRTVVTAMTGNSRTDNVFTNIDSAIIAG